MKLTYKVNFECIKDIFRKYNHIIFGVLALLLPDLTIKTLLGKGFFSQGFVCVVSWFFTFFWTALIMVFCAIILPKKYGKIAFSVISLFFIVYSFAEYVYYSIFNRFFKLQSILLAGEGAAYIDQVLQQIDVRLIIFAVLEMLFTVLAVVFWKDIKTTRKEKCVSVVIPILLVTVNHLSFKTIKVGNEWNEWATPRTVYNNFNDVNKNMEIAGVHQFVFRDTVSLITPKKQYTEEDFKRVDAYFDAKEIPEENSYTGLFKGKNVIAVMMESMDSWIINEKDTPTIHMMMNNGIKFTNYNAPFFGTGFTFSSEFSFNTGLLSPSDAASATEFNQNVFPYSLANLFRKAGYKANSFHFNDAEFYNRGKMHEAFGYEKYNSLGEYGVTGTERELDTNLIKNDGIYKKMTEGQPFFDFVITYSAHVPYTGKSPKLELCKEYYSEVINENENEKRNNIRVLAKDTDEFFRILLEKLESDGLLDDTVIIAYTDHFAYGLYDNDLLKEWKGGSFTYTIPAFIYAKGIEPAEISKPMMTIDWAPTIVNLFGLETDANYIGNDIFDPNNKGFALFETGAWLDDKMYYEQSYVEPCEEEKSYIQNNNNRVKESIEINDIIVMGDYYKYRN